MSPSVTAPWLTFVVLEGTALDDDVLKACATLFSNHYGVWGGEAPVPLIAVILSN
ncbi:hypothetical protein C8T65DRAFT_737517 [Cerioporus squamosus]|nr:hypothetical protein C8T65DRAFT_737517 [Cerioporus squamosus]